MRQNRPASLKTIKVKVRGTRHQNCQQSIRLLRVGSRVSLSPDPSNIYDKNAIRVTYRRRHLGWIPREMNVLVKGLSVRRAMIAEIGTDGDGFWHHLVLELAYVQDIDHDEAVQMSRDACNVLLHMHVKDIRAAEYIASLPKEDRQQAIDEWDSMHLTPEENDEAERTGDDHRPAVPTRNRKHSPTDVKR